MKAKLILSTILEGEKELYICSNIEEEYYEDFLKVFMDLAEAAVPSLAKQVEGFKFKNIETENRFKKLKEKRKIWLKEQSEI